MAGLAITRFGGRNSVTLRGEDASDHLWTGEDQVLLPRFTNCKRGAYGTRVAAQRTERGVHSVKRMLGCFVPIYRDNAQGRCRPSAQPISTMKLVFDDMIYWTSWMAKTFGGGE